MRYAQFLAGEEKYLAAESVLIDALRLSPGTPSLLGLLGQIYVQIKDWPRAEAVAKELEDLGEPETVNAAAAFRAAIFTGQQQTEQAIGYLQGLVDDGQGGLAAKIAIIRTHLANGNNDEALAYSARLLAEAPGDPSIRFIEASVRSVTGDFAAAEAAYRKLVEEDPGRVQVWMALYRVVAADPNRAAEIPALLDAAIAGSPDAPELKWAKAGFLERTGDVEGAIAIYEALYADDSTNLIIANNLASLLSTHRADEASLARAELISRRLRGSTVPAYQDTYGWVAYKRGNYEDALKELEKAAAGLPGVASVQLNLAMTYLALTRKAEALKYLNLAVELTEGAESDPVAVQARAEADKLVAEGVTPAP
jgi:tetratricopeptide (TPR) repeat protein